MSGTIKPGSDVGTDVVQHRRELNVSPGIEAIGQLESRANKRPGQFRETLDRIALAMGLSREQVNEAMA